MTANRHIEIHDVIQYNCDYFWSSDTVLKLNMTGGLQKATIYLLSNRKSPLRLILICIRSTSRRSNSQAYNGFYFWLIVSKESTSFCARNQIIPILCTWQIKFANGFLFQVQFFCHKRGRRGKTVLSYFAVSINAGLTKNHFQLMAF